MEKSRWFCVFRSASPCSPFECAAARAADPAWESLAPAVDVKHHVVAGAWTTGDGTVTTNTAAGSRLWLPFTPKGGYDVRISFTRYTGQHSIALFVPHGTGQVSFEVDAWGQHLAGFQNVSGQSIQHNTTRTPEISIRNGQRYEMTVEVRENRIRGLLDDKVVATLETDGNNLSVPEVWRLPHGSTLGLGAWESQVVFHTIEARMLDGKPVPHFEERRPPSVAATNPTLAPPRPPARRPRSGKRVLIVIANQDFFYREYAEPREELEKAGIEVVVAAGRNAACRPHANSGQGSGDGTVRPDVALADVRADNYDAILFSGGWGSSAYQFAFTGRYDNPDYNGQRAQPSCRWHPEANGAAMSPAGSIGHPGTAEDDVVVDGLIVTGEDDISARAMGRKIAELLSTQETAMRGR